MTGKEDIIHLYNAVSFKGPFKFTKVFYFIIHEFSRIFALHNKMEEVLGNHVNQYKKVKYKCQTYLQYKTVKLMSKINKENRKTTI